MFKLTQSCRNVFFIRFGLGWIDATTGMIQSFHNFRLHNFLIQ